MSFTGYTDISHIPYHESTETIGKEYVKKLMCGFVASVASVPYEIERAECESESDCHKELAEMLHSRVSEVASKIDEENYPDDDEKLKKNVGDASKVDCQEAIRVFHPNPKCRKMTDDANICCLLARLQSVNCLCSQPEANVVLYLDEIAEPNAVNFNRLEKPFFLTLKIAHQDKEVVNLEDKFDLSMSMMEDEEFCDVSFTVDKTEVKCHKAIYAHISYF